MAKNYNPLTDDWKELAMLAALYKEVEDKIKYGIVGEEYIKNLAQNKEFRKYLGTENAAEKAIESGMALYLNTLHQLRVEDYAKIVAQLYKSNKLGVLDKLKNTKIEELAEAAVRYANAEKKFAEAGKKKDRNLVSEALAEMEKYEKASQIYALLREIDKTRLETKYSGWLGSEIIDEHLGGLEKLLATSKVKKQFS